MNMAKIFKISGYLVDADDLYRLSEIEAGISYLIRMMSVKHWKSWIRRQLRSRDH